MKAQRLKIVLIREVVVIGSDQLVGVGARFVAHLPVKGKARGMELPKL